MLISELIEVLEDFKAKHGDLPVYITKEFVADTEVDVIFHTRAYQCLLGNQYLDHYSSRTEWKIEELENDMLAYADEHLDCTHCELYNKETNECIDYYKYEKLEEDFINGKIGYYEKPVPVRETKHCEWKDENVFTCFKPKNHIEDEPMYRMQHYLHILKKRLREEKGM